MRLRPALVVGIWRSRRACMRRSAHIGRFESCPHERGSRVERRVSIVVLQRSVRRNRWSRSDSASAPHQALDFKH